MNTFDVERANFEPNLRSFFKKYYRMAFDFERKSIQLTQLDITG